MLPFAIHCLVVPLGSGVSQCMKRWMWPRLGACTCQTEPSPTVRRVVPTVCSRRFTCVGFSNAFRNIHWARGMAQNVRS